MARLRALAIALPTAKSIIASEKAWAALSAASAAARIDAEWTFLQAVQAVLKETRGPVAAVKAVDAKDGSGDGGCITMLQARVASWKATISERVKGIAAETASMSSRRSLGRPLRALST